MRRLLIAIGILVIAVIAIRTSTVNAELENQIFSSKAHRLRIVVPRGWRATDQPSYPGLLVWMLRNQPDGKMVLSAEPFTRQVYCSWPLECRTSSEPLELKLACALRAKLTAQRLNVEPPQGGPKENIAAGLPSVYFDIDDGKRAVRQAVALTEDHVISLTLSAATKEARGAHIRAFDQALRTLRPLTDEEMGIPTLAPEAVVMQMVTDAGVVDAGPADAGAGGATTFAAAPVTKIAPVGSCAKP